MLESALARPENLAAYGNPDFADLAASYGLGLAKTPFLAGDYSIADIANYGWVWASEFSGIDLAPFPHVKKWKDTIGARAAVQKGQAVPTDDQKAKNKAPFAKR